MRAVGLSEFALRRVPQTRPIGSPTWMFNPHQATRLQPWQVGQLGPRFPYTYGSKLLTSRGLGLQSTSLPRNASPRGAQTRCACSRLAPWRVTEGRSLAAAPGASASRRAAGFLPLTAWPGCAGFVRMPGICFCGWGSPL